MLVRMEVNGLMRLLLVVVAVKWEGREVVIMKMGVLSGVTRQEAREYETSDHVVSLTKVNQANTPPNLKMITTTSDEFPFKKSC